MLTTELTYYGNVDVRGVVNDTTAHAQKHDIRVTSVLLSYIKILVVWVISVVWVMHYGSGMFKGKD